jgi:dTDP-4-dehydrorhamnose 3,5-epimerase
MEFKERIIKDVFEISLDPHTDDRGFFMRTFDSTLFGKVGLSFNWVQENHSLSLKKGTIRGLHFQFPPYCETKMIRCINGGILDVFVDIRNNSETFGKWDSIELTSQNNKMVLIPRGFAHGFCTLSENTEIVYKVDNFYSREHEGGIIWNDIDLAIKWPSYNPILSEKDKLNMSLHDFITKYKGI